VIPVFCGGLDFTKPVNAFFYDPLNPDQPLVDGVVSLTGFALVGGPARQDHPKAIEVLKKLNRPYMVALPLVFQTTQEWEESDLGLHPVQVALQIAIPELDGAIEPIVLSRTGSMPSPSAPFAGRPCGSSLAAIKSSPSRCLASPPTRATSVLPPTSTSLARSTGSWRRCAPRATTSVACPRPAKS
jgi:hypothetical protein